MTSFTSRYGDLAVDEQGAHAWAYCRHAATVVAISGRIDSANADCLTRYALRFVSAERPFVLDLGGVTSLTAGAIGTLTGIGDQCGAVGTTWALVAGDATAQLLADALDAAELAALPLAGSLAEAEHRFDEAILGRRRAVLSLFGKKTA